MPCLSFAVIKSSVKCSKLERLPEFNKKIKRPNSFLLPIARILDSFPEIKTSLINNTNYKSFKSQFKIFLNHSNQSLFDTSIQLLLSII